MHNHCVGTCYLMEIQFNAMILIFSWHWLCMSQIGIAVHASNCTFTNNSALKNGGAINVQVRDIFSRDAFGNHSKLLFVWICSHVFVEKGCTNLPQNNIFSIEASAIPGSCIRCVWTLRLYTQIWVEMDLIWFRSNKNPTQAHLNGFQVLHIIITKKIKYSAPVLMGQHILASTNAYRFGGGIIEHNKALSFHSFLLFSCFSLEQNFLMILQNYSFTRQQEADGTA